LQNRVTELLQRLTKVIGDALDRGSKASVESIERVSDDVNTVKMTRVRSDIDGKREVEATREGDEAEASQGNPAQAPIHADSPDQPITGDSDRPTTDPDRPLRVATWNIAGGRQSRTTEAFDYNEVNLPYFAEQLERVSPDVVCLQESEIDAAGSTAGELAERLGYPYVFETAMCPSHIDTSKTLGLAIISRIPFESTESVLLPATHLDLRLGGESVTPFDRYAQVAKVAGIDVVNLHPTPLGFFGHSYEEGAGVADAADIGQTIRSLIDGPGVVAADLNTDRPGVAYGSVFDELNLSPALEPGVRTVPGWDGSPDQVYSTPDLRATGSRVVPTETDHHLVWGDLDVTDPDLLARLVAARLGEQRP